MMHPDSVLASVGRSRELRAGPRSELRGPASGWLQAGVLSFIAASALGCGEFDSFQVITSEPRAGEIVEPTFEPRLTFSEPFDPVTCTEDTVYLARLGQSGQAEVAAAYRLHVVDQQTIALRDAVLWQGRWRLGVQSGRLGCQSQWGDGIEPFAVDFEVSD